MAMATYVHLANDGGIFVVRGTTCQEAWVTRANLINELDTAAQHSLSVLLSTQQALHRSPQIVADSLNVIAAANLSMVYTSEIHPRAIQEHGVTTLMKAAMEGRDDLVLDLLNRGADISATDDFAGYTALMCAAYAGKLSSLKLLVGAGADVNARDWVKSTPLMFAAQNGHREVVEFLLSAGANPKVRGKQCFRAVDLAIQNGHTEIAASLSAAIRKTTGIRSPKNLA